MGPVEIIHNGRVQMHKLNFNREECANFKHALDHVLGNRIADPLYSYKGWYSGREDQFIRRHLKTIAMLKEFIKET